MAPDADEIQQRLDKSLGVLVQAQKAGARTTQLNANVAKLRLELKQARGDLKKGQNFQVKRYNKWRSYRNPGISNLNTEDVLARLNQQQHKDYGNLEVPIPGDTPSTFYGHLPTGVYRPRATPEPGTQGFLLRAVPDLNPHWKGTKLLGAGGFGKVGLFEYRGPPKENDMPVTRVAVKEIHKDSRPDLDLRDEGELLRKLGTTISPHVVRPTSFQILHNVSHDFTIGKLHTENSLV